MFKNTSKRNRWYDQITNGKSRKNGELDNTIVVLISDHYLYTLEDKTLLDKYKETNTNLINHTPFIIWSNGQIKKQ